MRNCGKPSHTISQQYSWGRLRYGIRNQISRKEIGSEWVSGQCWGKGKADKFEEQMKAERKELVKRR